MRTPTYLSDAGGRAVVPDDWTCFVVADVHGVTSGLAAVLRAAGLTNQSGRWAARPKTALVIAGDLVGRGADTRGSIALVARLSADASAGGGRVLWVRGNHEQMLMDILAGDASSFEVWMDAGGRAGLVSLGVLRADEARPSLATVQRSLLAFHPMLRSLLASTLPYASWRSLLIVHAALPSAGPGRLGNIETLTASETYLRGRGPARIAGFSHLRGVVIGHWVQRRPTLYHGGLTLAIDTGAPRGGVVTLVALPAAGGLGGAKFHASSPRASDSAPLWAHGD